MAWEVFSFIGTAAFAISGALVAMEEKYDIFGVYILGIVTAFGGGALRNVLLGIPASVLVEPTLPFHRRFGLDHIHFLFFQIDPPSLESLGHLL